MRQFTFSTPALLAWLLLALTSIALGACGSTPTATPAHTSTPTPGATPNDGPTVSTWTANLPVGSDEGELAPDTSVMLVDGSTKPLSEVAAGKPLLLHFFATW